MTDKEPTPIRLRNPQPIILPTKPATLDERIDKRIRQTVSQMLYHLMRSEELLDIVNMSPQEFDAFVERVTAEEDA